VSQVKDKSEMFNYADKLTKRPDSYFLSSKKNQSKKNVLLFQKKLHNGNKITWYLE